MVSEITKELLQITSSLPITLTQTQLENIVLPDSYMQAVLAKEQAREGAEREKHNLARQKLEAQQKVNTAESERDARIAEADGIAYKIEKEAEAEARAIKLINEQLAESPHYVDLVRAKAWNGVLPQTLLGDSGNVLYSLK